MATIKQVKVGTTNFDVQSIEYISSTQSSSTNAWLGNTISVALDEGKVIAYKLNQEGTSSPATLNLTLSGGGTSGAKAIKINGTESVTNQLPSGSVILMIYDGTYWQVLGGGSSIELSTASESFIQSMTPTTATISYSNGSLIFGSSTMITGLTTTTGSAITAISEDSNIANAYGEYF